MKWVGDISDWEIKEVVRLKKLQHRKWLVKEALKEADEYVRERKENKTPE